jgi:ribonuclease III
MHHLEENLGYRFRNLSLLTRALTRKAYANEQRQRNTACEDQEVYCTLGDAVLKTVLIDLLIKAGTPTPDIVTQRKIELEREENLAAIGKRLGIAPSIRLGKGEARQNAGEQPYVLAETIEAIIGAIFLDGGYSSAETIIREWFGTLIPD